MPTPRPKRTQLMWSGKPLQDASDTACTLSGRIADQPDTRRLIRDHAVGATVPGFVLESNSQPLGQARPDTWGGKRIRPRFGQPPRARKHPRAKRFEAMLGSTMDSSSSCSRGAAPGDFECHLGSSFTDNFPQQVPAFPECAELASTTPWRRVMV